MISDEKCYFCKREVETFEHLLWDCPEVKKLWFNVREGLEPHIKLMEVLNSKTVLLGIGTDQNNILINHIKNIKIKNYIYVTKYDDQKLELSVCVWMEPLSVWSPGQSKNSVLYRTKYHSRMQQRK